MKRSFVYSDEEHAGLATRAPVPPETPAGDDRLEVERLESGGGGWWAVKVGGGWRWRWVVVGGGGGWW